MGEAAVPGYYGDGDFGSGREGWTRVLGEGVEIDVVEGFEDWVEKELG